MKAIIIGSGMAGLTSAATLAQAGVSVTIFEQYSQVGGVTAHFEHGGYHWDLGQLVIEGMGENEPGGSIFASLGVLDNVKTRLEDRGYIFPDFELRKPKEYQGTTWRIEKLKQLFPKESRGLDRYWQDFKRVMRVMTFGRRLDQSHGLASLWLKARLYLSLLPVLGKLNWSAQRLMDDYFTSDELKMVFMSILADFATRPDQFLGLGVFALNQEAVYDKRMPAKLGKDTEMLYHYSVLGGIGCLTDALVEKIEELGGKIYTNQAVEKIKVEDGKAVGVIDSLGQYWDADVIVASGGARELFVDMVGAEYLPADFIEHVKKIPLMCSVLMIHLGVDFDPSPYLHDVATYYYGTYDIDTTLDELKQGVYHEGEAGFVIHVPSMHTPEMAPSGCHAMTIYTVCPDRLRDENWSEKRDYYADRLVEFAEVHIPGLKSHIKERIILTPDDFRARLRIDPHAFGGLAPVMGAWRVKHQTPIHGLWFVGAQSESGGGVTTVVRTSYQVSQRILKNSRS